jgi:hypothetical protein
MNKFGIVIHPTVTTAQEQSEHIRFTAPDFVVVDLSGSGPAKQITERKKLVTLVRENNMEVHGIFSVGTNGPVTQATSVTVNAARYGITNIFLRTIEWPIRDKEAFVAAFIRALPQRLAIHVCSSWNYFQDSGTLASIVLTYLRKDRNRVYSVVPMFSSLDSDASYYESMVKIQHIPIETVILMDMSEYISGKSLSKMPASAKNILFWMWDKERSRGDLSKPYQLEENMPRKSKKTIVTLKERPIIATGLVLQGPLAKREGPSASARVKGTLQVGVTFDIVEIVNGDYAMTTTGLYVSLWSGKTTYVKVTPIR